MSRYERGIGTPWSCTKRFETRPKNLKTGRFSLVYSSEPNHPFWYSVEPELLDTPTILFRKAPDSFRVAD